SERLSSTYFGEVYSVVECGYAFELCGGGIKLLDKNGFNPIVGQNYKMTVGNDSPNSCGPLTLTMVSANCNYPYYPE
ncbi:MAG: hypothetical protein WBG62_20715, partial [Cyclobacteriaceae bacterium]